MNDIYITLSGNVTAEPRQFDSGNGSRVTSLRLASTPRLFDQVSRCWYDGETTYYTVRCYRVLAENVARSVRLGQPVVVHGKLRIRSYDSDGQRRLMAEVEAISVGHDLRRGVSSFEKPRRATPTAAPSSAGPGVTEPAGPEILDDTDLAAGAGTGVGSTRRNAEGLGGAEIPESGETSRSIGSCGTEPAESVRSGGRLAA